MRSARLTHALETGALALPDSGSIVVFRPRVGDDLSMIAKNRLLLVQGFRPDHDAFARLGFQVSLKAGSGHAAAIVCLPRAKAEAHALLAEASAAVREGGLVIVDGQKDDGIDSIWRELRKHVPVSEAIAKAHGKIFSFPAAPLPAEWGARPKIIEGGFQTLPGVFSADAPDKGSVLLAQALPAKLPARVVDLGAGWGYLSRAILARDGVKLLDLVEAEASALDCARINITDPRAQFHWADASVFDPSHPVDAVVCNPPFHTSRDADPALGMAFLRAAARLLTTSGTLWLVSNRHLPYDKTLATLFREVEDLGGTASFRLTRASRPLRARP